ncbi:MAG: helix-turn-helix transcriptional regulator [Caryophanon sp.]|nr:helix-turn-helix transcriptional regulator [Caryophanon sp.]
MRSLGKTIKQLREKKHISQKDFAEQLNISNVVLSRYENDIRKPDYDTLEKIADYFEVSIDYLLGRSDTLITQNDLYKGDFANLSQEQKEVLNFFLNLDDSAFKDKPTDILAALEQFELYYKLYKDQQAKKQL